MDNYILDQFLIREVRKVGRGYDDYVSEDTCDWYESDGDEDKLCKHFTGNKDKYNHVTYCRRYCTIMESKAMMNDVQQFKRVRGALRKK